MSNVDNNYGNYMGKRSCFGSWSTVAPNKRGLTSKIKDSGRKFPG